MCWLLSLALLVIGRGGFIQVLYYLILILNLRHTVLPNLLPHTCTLLPNLLPHAGGSMRALRHDFRGARAGSLPHPLYCLIYYILYFLMCDVPGNSLSTALIFF